jgi:hypothetical protein
MTAPFRPRSIDPVEPPRVVDSFSQTIWWLASKDTLARAEEIPGERYNGDQPYALVDSMIGDASM